MKSPVFLKDHLWQRLVADLIRAAQGRADPHAAVAEVISAAVLPESARADVERHAEPVAAVA